MKIEEILISITQYLERQQIPYVVVGGFAAVAWGRARTTYDIDIIVDQTKINIKELVHFFKTQGLETSEYDIDQAFKEHSHSSILSTGKSFFRIDLKGIYTHEDREAISTAKNVDYKGTTINFCSPENLIAHKLKFGSERDLEDALVVILAQKETIKWEYLEVLCARLDVTKKLRNLQKTAKIERM